MKSSSFPSVRVEPELLEAAESVHWGGEMLTSLIETAVRETIRCRRVHEKFIAGGPRSREDARHVLPNAARGHCTTAAAPTVRWWWAVRHEVLPRD